MLHKRSHQKSPFFYTHEVCKGVAALHQLVCAARRCCCFGWVVRRHRWALELLCKHPTKCLWSRTESLSISCHQVLVLISTLAKRTCTVTTLTPQPANHDLKPLILVILSLHLHQAGSQTKFVLFSNLSLLNIKPKHLLACLSSLVSGEEDFHLLMLLRCVLPSIELNVLRYPSQSKIVTRKTPWKKQELLVVIYFLLLVVPNGASTCVNLKLRNGHTPVTAAASWIKLQLTCNKLTSLCFVLLVLF